MCAYSALLFHFKIQGIRCEIFVSPCITPGGHSICLNSGFCTENYNIPPFYYCSCLAGFFGINCEISATTSTSTGVFYSQNKNCLDQDSNVFNCVLYAKNNLCNNLLYRDGKHGVPVYYYCPFSCNRCA